MHQRPIGGRPRRYMAQPPPQNGARSDAGDAAQLGHSFKAATSNGLLMPSHQAYWALLLLPCVGWLLAVVSGMVHFEGIPADKRAVHHELTWFDRNVFRTVAGPGLVFLVLLLRCLIAYLSAAANSKASTAISREAALDTELTPLASMATVSSGSPLDTSASVTTATPVAPSATVTSSATVTTVGVRALPQATLPRFCLLAYASVAGMRMVMYGMHLALIRYTATQNNLSAKEVPSYLSDHLLLGASVVTSLQVELICAVSDKTKLDVLGLPLVWHILTCCAGLASLLLSCLVSADMYFTAKLFHHPQESLVALVIGAVSLQVPLLWWLHRQKYAVCKSSNASERS
ncbi:hypothetical protein DUNSADRAFT_14110 [Dunaliella salina]|uniref:Uncharacterized protein n=1 Tax=Dunaliella salina TaxID=3046 RepID=A0ABQ7G7Y9_DUNSA|nr:hypothetical protein DUNSADRAFT_14110 [Dunaliella salina]KAF5830728.1 hypothetical protein DUNSADRAFT_14110 [Dunaliella salina]|eukprot:KAF5830727.1 hypothetical protein DUNSADRAFT_14110 [Dunaliella salina]